MIPNVGPTASPLFSKARTRARLAICSAVVLALLGIGGAPSAGQDAPSTEPFQIPVQQHVLDNGLKVLVVENPSAETVSCRLFFRVGSANEQPGLTGLAHFFEHLMFKGTKTIGVKDLEADARIMRQIDRVGEAMRDIRLQAERSADDDERYAALERDLADLIEQQRDVVEKNETMETYRNAGATGLNASTSRDWTQYQVTLPANKLELFFWMESDRLQNAVFREFYAEKDVVREERRLRENNPSAKFGEAYNKVTYGSHPYAWPTLGWHSDLLNATRADAQAFFDTWYVPDNAVMVLVGNVKASDANALAEKYFGRIPKGTKRRPHITPSRPPAAGERRLVGHADTQPSVRIAYYREPAGHADEAAYEMLSEILAGDTGRLETTVVRRDNLATGTRVSAFPSRYLSTFDVSATTKGDTRPETLLAAIDAELARVVEEGVTEAELQKARNSLAAELVGIMQDDGTLCIVLGIYEVSMGTESLNRTIAAVESVTPADVQRVARDLFRPENRSVGLLYRLDAPATPAAESAQPTSPPTRPEPETPAPEAVESDIPAHPNDLVYPERPFVAPDPLAHRVVLENGLRVYLMPDKRYPTISLTAHIKAGSLWEPADAVGLAAATGQLMKRGGTASLSEDELDEQLALRAATLSSGFGESTGAVSLSTFARDFDETLEYFSDVLRAPAFRADRLTRFKEEALQAIGRRNENPRGIYQREFRRVVYGDSTRGFGGLSGGMGGGGTGGFGGGGFGSGFFSLPAEKAAKGRR